MPEANTNLLLGTGLAQQGSVNLGSNPLAQLSEIYVLPAQPNFDTRLILNFASVMS
jgi:hypothetical protein